MKNRLIDFKIYYQNIRALKTKIDSLAVTIDNYEPTLICLVETHLSKEEQIQIPGYKIFRNDGTSNNRGILIAVKKKLKTIVVDVNRKEEIGRTLSELLAYVRYFLSNFYFSPNDRPSKTMKNTFYFI